MKRVVALLFLTTVTVGAYAQQWSLGRQWPMELWHDGKIVLLDGDTLKGKVKYDLQQDAVQYNTSDQRIEAFSARKVLFFEIFDVTVNKYRQFFALPYSANSSYRVPTFFELLEEGKMTLLAREALEYRTTSNSSYYGGTYTRVELVYTYFFLDESGDIKQFIGNKNDLLDLMGNKAEAVEKYMKANRLNHDDKYDFAKIITYYNSLFGT
jgi:hypothetical protein